MENIPLVYFSCHWLLKTFAFKGHFLQAKCSRGWWILQLVSYSSLQVRLLKYNEILQRIVEFFMFPDQSYQNSDTTINTCIQIFYRCFQVLVGRVAYKNEWMVESFSLLLENSNLGYVFKVKLDHII